MLSLLDEKQSTPWIAFVCAFDHVEKLHFSEGPSVAVACALQSVFPEMATDVLPTLCKLRFDSVTSESWVAVTSFIDVRSSASLPSVMVVLHGPEVTNKYIRSWCLSSAYENLWRLSRTGSKHVDYRLRSSHSVNQKYEENMLFFLQMRPHNRARSLNISFPHRIVTIHSMPYHSFYKLRPHLHCQPRPNISVPPHRLIATSWV
ncbi:hypothetical protein EDB86DRAFT_2186195 [Lactarius hatsudake]|nr:hypothetical protein EDB86DRAFT_2186195 [Lactarius hatsudake]